MKKKFYLLCTLYVLAAAITPIWSMKRLHEDTAQSASNKKQRTLDIQETFMHEAVLSQSPLLQDFIENSVAVNAQDRKGRTPLHLAISKKNYSAIHHLIQAGADYLIKDTMQNSALYLALKTNDQSAIEAMHTANQNKQLFANQLLYHAVKYNFYHFVDLALSINFNADVNNSVHNGLTPLFVAVAQSKSKFVKKLLTHPTIDINIGVKNNGTTALHAASCNGNIEIVRLLLGHSNTNVNVTDDQGTTPLHYAAGRGYNDIALSLINAGANVHAQTNSIIGDDTPLDGAIKEKHYSMAQLLIAHRAPTKTLPTSTGDARINALCITARVLDNALAANQKNNAIEHLIDGMHELKKFVASVNIAGNSEKEKIIAALHFRIFNTLLFDHLWKHNNDNLQQVLAKYAPNFGYASALQNYIFDHKYTYKKALATAQELPSKELALFKFSE